MHAMTSPFLVGLFIRSVTKKRLSRGTQYETTGFDIKRKIDFFRNKLNKVHRNNLNVAILSCIKLKQRSIILPLNIKKVCDSILYVLTTNFFTTQHFKGKIQKILYLYYKAKVL